MHRLLPASAPPGELSDGELAAHYAHPDPGDRPWLRMNFVTGADGAVAVDGVSGGLSSAADQRVFRLLRELCEVILVGAGTVRAEGYRGIRVPSRASGHPPRIAVISGRAELDPGSPLFTDTEVPPLVLTTSAADPGARRRLADAGAEVLAAETDEVSPAWVLGELGRRGLRRVLGEGGPALFGRLLAADAVDELCLTVAPLLTGGTGGRISTGPEHPGRELRLAGALEEDGVLLLRYLRAR